MPISPDKSVGPVQIIQFLGLTIGTVHMVIQIPPRQKGRHTTNNTEGVMEQKVSQLQGS